jgi:hypothetical protein
MDALHTHLGIDVAALCGSGDVLSLLGIAAALFVTALVGGFAHCAPMCGPFVLMQVASPGGETLALKRLAFGALPGYQLGRLTTYVGLGMLSGGIGGSLSALAPFRTLAAALLALAALVFLLQGLGGLGRFLPGAGLARFGGFYAGPLARLAAPLLRRGVGGYRLGLVLGFLPCGFLYAALIAAAASGGALAGGFAMAGFALGTIPALALVGILGAGAMRRWRPLAATVAPLVFLLNAATLGGLAARLAG